MKKSNRETIDIQLMRKTNKNLVFREIFKASPISRVEISKKLGLNRATVSSLVDELLQKHWIQEIGYGRSRGGRKPMLLSIRPGAAYTIGIDFQITHIQAALFDSLSNITFERKYSLSIPKGNSQQIIYEAILKAITELQVHIPQSPHGIIGIGIAIPGMASYETGIIHYLPNLEILNWDLSSLLYNALGIPIFIDNDANCGVLSKYYETHEENIVFINAGIGVGGGIISKGEIVRGSRGIAGEYGHTTISAMGLQCTCGSYGCWEQYSSERALFRYLKDAGSINKHEFPSSTFIDECIALADQKQSIYIEAFRTLGEYLGIGISNILNSTNPNCIYLGGNLAKSAHLILNDIRRVVKVRSLPLNHDVEIKVSNQETVVRGAGSLPIISLLLNQTTSIID